ncbi:MAG TPA: hypothetical protein VKI64_05570, partial [Acidimicrobiales bacterium]|nr:hypothetical protein [Acidimicrobiales bacterium]
MAAWAPPAGDTATFPAAPAAEGALAEDAAEGAAAPEAAPACAASDPGAWLAGAAVHPAAPSDESVVAGAAPAETEAAASVCVPLAGAEARLRAAAARSSLATSVPTTIAVVDMLKPATRTLDPMAGWRRRLVRRGAPSMLDPGSGHVDSAPRGPGAAVSSPRGPMATAATTSPAAGETWAADRRRA